MQNYGLHINAMANQNAILENGDVPTKSIISKLLLNRNYKTWYKIKALTQAFYLLIR